MKNTAAKLDDELLDVAEAARLLHIKPGTLAQWRVYGKGPRFVRLGRAVRYTQKDLAAYVAARTTQSTSEPVA
jgi:predicted DNA-binding transcriptional regulator AlpA